MLSKLDNCEDARLLDAVRAAGATHLVDRLSAGFDTQLGRQFDGVEPAAYAVSDR